MEENNRSFDRCFYFYIHPIHLKRFKEKFIELFNLELVKEISGELFYNNECMNVFLKPREKYGMVTFFDSVCDCSYANAVKYFLTHYQEECGFKSFLRDISNRIEASLNGF